MTGRGKGVASPYLYDAFVSYSRSDEELASAVQAGLQTYARPWNRPRALRVFRDKTDITGARGLRQVIEEGLATSRWLILLASPESAASEWVATELRWWLEHRGTANLLIALARGEIAWLGDDFDWNRTTALADDVFSGRFSNEPVWVEVRGAISGDDSSGRLSDKTIVEFAAPIHDRPKADLMAEHGRQARRTRRVRRNVMATLCALVLAASATAIYASREQHSAGQQATIATARNLASASNGLLSTNLQLAELLAVQAYRTHRDLSTEMALFKAVTSSPFLVRYLNVGRQVSALASADSGQVALAGTADGLVESWPLRAGRPRVLARLRQKITDVAGDADAGEVLATTASSAVLSGPRIRPRVLQIPGFSQHKEIAAAAISPSGRYVAFDSYLRGIATGAVAGGSTVTIIDVHTGQVRQRVVPLDAFAMAIPDDGQVVLATEAGPWMRLAVPAMTTVMSPTQASTGVHGFQQALSPGGKYFGYDNGGVNLWNTTKYAGNDSSPDLNGRSHGLTEQVLAIAADGSAVAVADGGTIYVSRTSKGRTLSPYPQLSLPGDANIGSLTFAGDRNHLLAASGQSIAVWDMNQPSQLARTIGVKLPEGCNACPSPGIMVAPGGRETALSGGNTTAVAVVSLDRASRRYVRTHGLESQMLALGWISSRRLLLLTGESQSPFLETFDGSAFADQEPATTGQYQALAPIGEDGAVIEYSDSGSVLIHDPGHTGEDRIFSLGHSGEDDVSWTVSPDERFIAENTQTAARVASLQTGQALTVGHGAASTATFSGDHLIIQRKSGIIEIWNEAGSELQHQYGRGSSFLGITTSLGASPAIIGSLLVRQQSPGVFTVTDLSTGTSLGSLSMPDVASTTFKSAMAADGGLLLTSSEGDDLAGDGGQLVIWQLTPRAWASLACQAAGIALSPAQYEHYAPGQPVPARLACSR